MDTFLVAAGSAFWLGIATAISPCPLATNIAAVSFIGRRAGNPRRVFLSGLLYTGGRTITYLVLGIILVAGLLSIGELSLGLQAYMNKILGPILILAGMVLLELIRLPTSGGGLGGRMQRRAETGGLWTAALLGIVFALSFCPLSAVLFFGCRPCMVSAPVFRWWYLPG
jgi:cytochrome c-type biogenesis protein